MTRNWCLKLHVTYFLKFACLLIISIFVLYIYPCQWFIASWDDVGWRPKRIWTLTEINNINKYIMSGTGHLTSGVNFIWSGARWSMSVHPLRLTVSHASLVFIGACWFVDHQMICTCRYKIYQNFKFYLLFLQLSCFSVNRHLLIRRSWNDLYIHI